MKKTMKYTLEVGAFKDFKQFYALHPIMDCQDEVYLEVEVTRNHLYGFNVYAEDDADITAFLTDETAGNILRAYNKDVDDEIKRVFASDEYFCFADQFGNDDC
jgi:sulfur transfer protein SufE